jgi:pilus assembly protein Flp/PilA
MRWSPKQLARRGREDGGSAVEYGLLAAGVAGVVAAAVFLFGGSVQGLFNQTCYAISTGASGHAGSVSC